MIDDGGAIAGADARHTRGRGGATVGPRAAPISTLADIARRRRGTVSTGLVSLSAADIIRTSRPRFWIYLLGPFMVALATTNLRPPVEVWLLGLYLTLPANLLIYGVNDLFDAETDRLNPKKRDYEAMLQPAQRRALVGVILATNLPFVPLVLILPHAWPWLLLFLFTGIGYSVPPVRAKGRPVLDAAFNVLYVAPGFAAYATLTAGTPPLALLAAAWLWCMAMHAYSAVPDIPADLAAGLSTVATRLGERRTLLVCGAAYALSAALTFRTLGAFAVMGGLIYLAMIALSLRALRGGKLFAVYRWFPLVNTAVGGLLFCVTGLQNATWPFNQL